MSKQGQRKVYFENKEFLYATINSSKQFVIEEQKFNSSFASYIEAHKCLGHPGENVMKILKQRYSNLIPNKPEGFHCPSCILSKSIHHSETSRPKRAKKRFQIIHSDLSGKFSVDSLGKKRYYISFIDDYSRYAWICFLRDKSDTNQAIRDYVMKIKNQYGITVKTFFSDNGGEYIDHRVQQFLAELGIGHQNSPPYEHESNGVAERFNRTIVTKARTLLIDFPKVLWAEAIATSVYLYNRTPHRTNEYRSPIELLDDSSAPSASNFRTFGCKVYVHIPKETRSSGSKLQPRAIEGNF